MTITTEVAFVSAAGDGVATIYAFSPMTITKSSDILAVVVDDSDGSKVTLSEGTGPTNYSVSVTSYPGTGFITYPASGGAPLAVGFTMEISRQVDLLQPTDIVNNQSYLPDAVERRFDDVVRSLQDIDHRVDTVTNAVSGLDVITADVTDASNVTYDTLASGLSGTNVQDAIDEVVADYTAADALLVPQTTTITTSGPISGGGDLSANRDIGMDSIAGLSGSYGPATNYTLDEYGRAIAAAADTIQAAEVSYDTLTSGLAGTNVQDAIDEVVAEKAEDTISITGTGALTGGGTLEASRTIDIDTIAGVAGTYARADVQINTQGQVTVASSNDTITALETTYDNTTSGLTATNVKAALDEVVAEKAEDTISITGTGALTGGGTLEASRTIDIDTIAGVAGTYSPANIQVNTQGQVTVAGNNTNSITGTGALTGGGDLTANRTMDIDTIAGVSGSYSHPNITVSTQGRVTAVTDGLGTPRFNVKDYGAVGDDSTDDTTAIDSAITALEAAGAGVLYFPAGIYKVTAQLSITGADVTILGDGAATSIVKWYTTSTGGFSVSVVRAGTAGYLSDWGYYFSCRNLSLVTTVTNGGTALSVTGSHTTGRLDPSNDISFVSIYGSSNVAYWLQGIVLDEVSQINLVGVKLDGKTSGSPGFNASAKGVVLISANNNSNNFYFDACQWAFWARCISIEGSTGTQLGIEGVVVQNSVFLASQFGIHNRTDATTGSSEGLQVANCHFACYEAAIYGHFVQFTIDHNLIYDNSTLTTSSHALIRLFGSATSGSTSEVGTISDNIFVELNSGGENAILLGQSDAGSVSNITVSGNVFQFGTGTPLVLRPNCSNITVIGNRVSGTGNGYVANSMAVNTGFVSLDGRKASQRLTALQTIPNVTETVLVFNEQTFDTDSLRTTAGARFTIPNVVDRILKVRFDWFVHFDDSSGGFRLVFLRHYGSAAGAVVGGQTDGAPISGQPCLLSGSTPIIPVTANDYFTLSVYQTSGGNLDVLSGSGIHMEVIH